MKQFSVYKRNKTISEIDSKTGETDYNDNQFLDVFINVNSFNLDLSEELYRIFKWDHFIDDLLNKKLTLVRTFKWDDKFENFMLNFPALYNDKVGDLSNLRDSFYVSCWSLKSECDGLWRSYKPNKRNCSVKVKVNAKKLFASIYNIKNINHDSNYFIGKVRYISDNEILNILKRTYKLRDLDDGLIFAQQLFIKRKPFKYEQEVRIIVRDENYNDDIMKIQIDPNLLFEEIILDPWIKLSTFKKKMREIKDAGYFGSITRSSLYDKSTNLFLKLK